MSSLLFLVAVSQNAIFLVPFLLCLKVALRTARVNCLLLDECDCEFARLTCFVVLGSFGFPGPVLIGDVDGDVVFSAVPLLFALAGLSLSSTYKQWLESAIEASSSTSGSLVPSSM